MFTPNDTPASKVEKRIKYRKFNLPEMQVVIAGLINESYAMTEEYGIGARDNAGLTVAEVYAEKILDQLRERCRGANMPEPRYAYPDDEKIKDQYVAGFVTGRYEERRGFLHVLGLSWEELGIKRIKPMSRKEHDELEWQRYLHSNNHANWKGSPYAPQASNESGKP